MKRIVYFILFMLSVLQESVTNANSSYRYIESELNKIKSSTAQNYKPLQTHARALKRLSRKEIEHAQIYKGVPSQYYSYIYKSSSYIPMAYKNHYLGFYYGANPSKECYPIDQMCIYDWKEQNGKLQVFFYCLLSIPFILILVVLAFRKKAETGFRQTEDLQQIHAASDKTITTMIDPKTAKLKKSSTVVHKNIKNKSQIIPKIDLKTVRQEDYQTMDLDTLRCHFEAQDLETRRAGGLTQTEENHQKKLALLEQNVSFQGLSRSEKVQFMIKMDAPIIKQSNKGYGRSKTTHKKRAH